MNINRRRIVSAIGTLPWLGLAARAVASAAIPQPSKRFTLEWGSEGQLRVIGGVFMPEPTPPRLAFQQTLLSVDFTTKELMLHGNDDKGVMQPRMGLAVVTPRPETLPRTEVRGLLRRIDRRPTWCPPQSALTKYPALRSELVRSGGSCFPFGHQYNAMGAVKLVVDWRGVDESWEARHLHGTAGFPRDFLNAETLGCVRIIDSHILVLADLLEERLRVGPVEVVWWRS